MSGYEAWKLVKNGRVWDYTLNAGDLGAWMDKIWREEPGADVHVEVATRQEMANWKAGEWVDLGVEKVKVRRLCVKWRGQHLVSAAVKLDEAEMKTVLKVAVVLEKAGLSLTFV